MISRETIYAPLFAMLTGLRAPGAVDGPPDGSSSYGLTAAPGVPTLSQPFNMVSREVIEVQRVPPALQPVLFMDETIEEYVRSGDGLYYHRWSVFFHVGCTSPKGTAMSGIINPLMDAVEALFVNAMEDDILQLGDVIARAQFFGVSPKDLANNSTKPEYRQAASYMPFEIVFPSI